MLIQFPHIAMMNNKQLTREMLQGVSDPASEGT